MELTISLSVQMCLLIALGLVGAAGQSEEVELRPERASSEEQEVRTWSMSNKTATLKAPNRPRISANSQSDLELSRLKTGGSREDASHSRRNHETIDGVVQATRVARHVKRKLDQLNARVSQLGSMIAQDHPSKAGERRQARQEDDSLTIDEDKGASSKEQWSAPLSDEQSPGGSSGDGDQVNESDEGASRANSTRADQMAAATSTRWSAPVIESVIPGRDHHSRDQQHRLSQEQVRPDISRDQGSSDAKDAGAATNEPPHFPHDSNSIDQDQSASNSSQESLPSMMGPEWTPNSNYNYFSELNAKNHGGAALTPTADRLQRVSEAPFERTASNGKFQNMTIVNSDTDLVNSYSNNGVQLSIANGSHPVHSSSAPMSARRSSQRADSEQTSAALANHQASKKSSSVKTYTAGNYGKSSRELQQTSTTSQPYYTQEQPISWSQGQQHANESSYDHALDQHQAIRWPALATAAPPSASYTSAGENPDQIQLALPPSTSNVPQATRYSDVMRPASNMADAFRPFGQHPQHRAHRSGGGHNFKPSVNELHGNDDMATTNDDSSLSAHRYSVAQVEPPADHSDPNQRRRSIEAQQQLTTTTDTTIYERQHQMQQPPPIDIYSSRVDNGPVGPLVDSPIMSGLNASASTMSAATTMAPAVISQDLKHRSTSNAISNDEPLIYPYGSSSDGSTLSAMEAPQHQPESASNNLFVNSNSPDSFKPLQSSPAQGTASHYYLSSQADLQNAHMASNGHGSDGSTIYALDSPDSNSQQQQALMSQLDNRVNEMSAQDQQAYFNAQGALANRAYGQNSFAQQQGQFLRAPTSIQDAIQQSATSGYTDPAAGQQAQISRAIGEYNARLQRYQQLAAHLAQQQQQQLQQQQSSTLANLGQRSLVHSLARHHYSSPASSSSLVDQQAAESTTSSLESALQNNMRRRYSPETVLANYLTARSSQSANYGAADSSVSQPAYTFFQPQQQATQSAPQLYPPLSYNAAAVKASLAQAAYQRLLAQAAAGNNQPSGGTTAQLAHLTPSFLANLYSALAQQHQQSQQASSGGSMLATAAMPQPVFYEAPSQMSQHSAKADGGATYAHDESSARLSTSSSSSPSAPTSSSSGGSSPKSRGYLASLFKPTASSRYYYGGPTLLSPISLSPSTLGAIYAPSSAAMPQSGADGLTPAMSQFYANPYALAAAMSQSAVAHAASHPFSHHAHHHQHQTPASYQDPQSLAAQQYQALAAAAAASAFHPQYLSAPPSQGLDTEMAESSMVPSESSGSFASPSDSSSSSASGEAGDSSTAKSGGSMKQWLTVASLLAGILPMGLVMASMLPMLSVTGRKKRELEFTARNFSEIFSSWRPSKILDAIMSASNDTIGLANATRILGELTSSASERAQQSADTIKFNQGKFVNNKSARLLASHKAGTRYQLLSQTTQKPANETAVQDSSTTLNLPAHSTTPLPKTTSFPMQPVKSTVRKVLDKMTNLIETAQKRKHRSSLVDSHWSLAHPSGKLPNFVKNMFDFNEVKRYLSDLVRAKLIASAQAAKNEPLLRYLNGLGQQAPFVADTKQATRASTEPLASSRTSSDQLQTETSVQSSKKRPLPNKSLLAQTSTQIRITSDKNNSPPLSSGSVNSTATSRPGADLNSAAPSSETGQKRMLDDGGIQKRGSLLSCLQNVICDLASKLRKASIEQNPRNGTRTDADDKQMTHGILSQLIDYIVDADRETQIFGHELRNESRDGHNEIFIGLIQEAVLKQQCAGTFVCPDPHKFKRIFAELKWPKRK